MQLIEWKKEFSLGIPAVDHEHRELINLINEVLVHINENKIDEKSVEYLGEIHAKIASHFALEEKIMLEKKYDQYLDHKNDHEKLLDDIREMMDRLDNNTDVDIDDFSGHLTQWFTRHFQTRDARLHKHLGI